MHWPAIYYSAMLMLLVIFFYFSEDRTEAKRTINHWFVEFSGWGLRRRGEGWSSDHLFIFSIATARSHEHT